MGRGGPAGRFPLPAVAAAGGGGGRCFASLDAFERWRGRGVQQQGRLTVASGVLSRASGSALVAWGGDTKVLAAVTGPKPFESARESVSFAGTGHGSVGLRVEYVEEEEGAAGAAGGGATAGFEGGAEGGALGADCAVDGAGAASGCDAAGFAVDDSGGSEAFGAAAAGCDAFGAPAAAFASYFLRESLDALVLTDQFPGASVEVSVFVLASAAPRLAPAAQAAVVAALVDARVPLRDIVPAVCVAAFEPPATPLPATLPPPAASPPAAFRGSAAGAELADGWGSDVRPGGAGAAENRRRKRTDLPLEPAHSGAGGTGEANAENAPDGVASSGPGPPLLVLDPQAGEIAHGMRIGGTFFRCTGRLTAALGGAHRAVAAIASAGDFRADLHAQMLRLAESAAGQTALQLREGIKRTFEQERQALAGAAAGSTTAEGPADGGREGRSDGYAGAAARGQAAGRAAGGAGGAGGLGDGDGEVGDDDEDDDENCVFL